jgi:hypothetical protein
MIKDTSGYDSFDQLNRQAAIASGGHSIAGQPSRFSSALSSINQFLKTATDTIVTVDGVINKDQQSFSQQPLYPGQTQAKASGGGSMMTYLAIAGLAVGGGMIVTKVFSR